VSSAARRIILLASVALGVGAISFVAFGWWTGVGSGSAGAAVATFGAPGTPAVSVTASVASVSWSAASAPGAGAVDYHVERRETSDLIWRDVCGTTASIRITALECSDVPGDGTFEWRVTAFFHSWTATSGTSTSVTIDSKPPTGSVTAPASGASVAGTLTVTSDSADDGTGVASAQFQTSPAGADSWTDLGAADTTSPYSASWNTTTFSDGLYDVRVITTDNAGLTFTSPTVTSVLVDNAAPSVSLALANGPTGAYLSAGKVYFKSNAAGSFGLVATVTDAGSGAASATFPSLSAAGWTTHNAETDTTPAGGPYASSTFVWASGASAPATYTVSAADGAGNTATAAVTFTIDTTAPTGAVTAPAAAANVRGSVVVTSNSADAGSGVASAQFQASPAGAGTWSNIGAADTVTPYATTWDTTASADGLYDLRVITTDNLGTSFTSATIANVRIDNTAPSGSLTAPAAAAAIKGTFTLTSDSADAGSGVANALFQRSPAGANTWTNVAAADVTSPYTASWVTTGVSDGLYDLQVITTDKSGNTFTSALITNVRVDNTAPGVAAVVTNGAPSAFQSGTKIYFKSNIAGSFGLVATVTDSGSGAASATFPVLATAGWTHAAETVSAPAGGPYASASFVWASGASTPGTYTVTVLDAAGNAATSAFTFTADATAPTGSVTAPAAAANVRGSVAVTSNSADAGAGVGSAQFQASPAGAGTWSNLGAADTLTPFSTTWDTTGSTDALYDLRVSTSDNVGNTFTSATIANVRVDNTAPTGSITAPAANAFVNGASVAVSANSADTGSGVSSAQFQTSPHGAGTWSNLGAADATSPYGVTWNTTTYADGQYDVRVVTTDKSGNTFTSPAVMAEVQNAAPTATAVQLLDGGATAGKAEQGDRVVATFSETLRVSTMCSTWSGDFSDQTLAALGDVTVTLTDGGVGNDTLTVTSASCTFHFGTINLGSTGYVTGVNVTFSGSTTADRSTIAWSASTRTLTITLGHSAGVGVAGTVASSAATYTPDAAIKSGFGTTITGTFNTGILTQF
jgi:hypothetical protein